MTSFADGLVIEQPTGTGASTITPTTAVNVGTVATAATTTVVEQGDTTNHKTVLTLTDFAVGSAVGAADLAFGALLYTLPAGAQIIDASYFSLSVTGTTTIVGDTPEIGLGSTIATGAIATLSTTMEDYVLGSPASAAISGATPLVKLTGVTAGAVTGIALNVAASSKAIYLNCADGWAGAGDVTATGTVTITWKFIA